MKSQRVKRVTEKNCRGGVRTVTQNRQLWGLVGQLAKLTGLGKEEAVELMRQECAEISGQRSSAALTGPQAAKLIAKLKYLAWRASGGEGRAKSKEQRTKTYSPLESVSKAMLELIEHLWEDARIYQGKSRQGFTKRITGKPWPQTIDDGSKLIEALKGVVERRSSLVELFCRANRLLKQRADRLTDWERGFLEKIREELRSGRMITSGAIGKLKEIENKLRSAGVGELRSAGVNSITLQLPNSLTP